VWPFFDSPDAAVFLNRNFSLWYFLTDSSRCPLLIGTALSPCWIRHHLLSINTHKIITFIFIFHNNNDDNITYIVTNMAYIQVSGWNPWTIYPKVSYVFPQFFQGGVRSLFRMVELWLCIK
jgi:hypothetical protein